MGELHRAGSAQFAKDLLAYAGLGIDETTFLAITVPLFSCSTLVTVPPLPAPSPRAS